MLTSQNSIYDIDLDNKSIILVLRISIYDPNITMKIDYKQIIGNDTLIENKNTNVNELMDESKCTIT